MQEAGAGPDRPGSSGPGGSGPDLPDLPGLNRPAKKQERGNDYCQHFVDTGGRPQNFLRGGCWHQGCAVHPTGEKTA